MSRYSSPPDPPPASRLISSSNLRFSRTQRCDSPAGQTQASRTETIIAFHGLSFPGVPKADHWRVLFIAMPVSGMPGHSANDWSIQTNMAYIRTYQPVQHMRKWRAHHVKEFAHDLAMKGESADRDRKWGWAARCKSQTGLTAAAQRGFARPQSARFRASHTHGQIVNRF